MAYSNNIIRRAEQILGYGISNVVGKREYSVVDGVIYTDLFKGEVTIPGYSGTLKRAFNGKFNGLTYYNEIHLTNKCKTDTVELELDWGSTAFDAEIDDLLKWLEDNSAADILDTANVESKKIEDFTVRYKNTEEAEASIMDSISAGWGYYIRRPLIIGVAREQRNDWRYF